MFTEKSKDIKSMKANQKSKILAKIQNGTEQTDAIDG